MPDFKVISRDGYAGSDYDLIVISVGGADAPQREIEAEFWPCLAPGGRLINTRMKLTGARRTA